MAKKPEPSAAGQTRLESWLKAPVDALAPLFTLEKAHDLLAALARTGPLGGGDEEEEAAPVPLHHPA